MNTSVEKEQEPVALKQLFLGVSHGLGDPHAEGLQEEGKKRRRQYLQIQE